MFPRLGLWEVALTFSILFFMLPAYFAPTIIAAIRKTKHLIAIIILNWLGGWTFLGWVASLIWALVDEKRPQALKAK